MAQIFKLPVPAPRRGYRRVRTRCKGADNPDQLDLFAETNTAQILSFSSGLSPFAEALLSDQRGDPQAARLYAEAIEKEDCVADACCNLGIIETQRGNTTKAFDCFTTALKHNPRHSEAHYNLANLYFELNDYRLAQVHFEMAVTVDPSFANAHFNLGLVQAINGHLAAAVQTLGHYQTLADAEEAQRAEEVIEQFRRALAHSNGAV